MGKFQLTACNHSYLNFIKVFSSCQPGLSFIHWGSGQAGIWAGSEWLLGWARGWLGIMSPQATL